MCNTINEHKWIGLYSKQYVVVTRVLWNFAEMKMIIIEMKILSSFSIAQSLKKEKILKFYVCFKQAVRNIKGWIKICASYVVYNKIWPDLLKDNYHLLKTYW